MAIASENIIAIVQERFGDKIQRAVESHGILTLEIDARSILPVLSFLKEDSRLGFNFLTDICGVHYPEQEQRELGVAYHLHNMMERTRLRIKCWIPVEKPEIASACEMYAGANWMERETFDFYGVIFTGHPNLKRILNVDEMDYFPMRKEYPLEDGTRTDKHDEYFGR